jgi:EAL domain-containing protein (putative c-di-GMP-specific phosphodiesterase class I)
VSVERAAAELLSELEEVRVSARSTVLRLSPTVGALWVERRPGLAPCAIGVALRDAENAASLHVERPLHLGRLDDVGMAAYLDRLSATERVREAIASQRLVLLAQPIVANAPAQVAAGHDVEVLVRLLDPEGALITPAEFLPIVASADLAVALDRAVVARVFDWFRDRPQVLARTAKCAINLSATSLADPDFPRFVEAAMAARGLAADRLAFEITESSQLVNPALAAESLARLRSLGFRVALDDFGTGLSTFDYLKKLPVDYIKIDGAFIRDLESDPMDAEIVASMVRVAASCGLRTVAEYVSSESLRARVTALGVDYSQGYAIGRPIPIEEALA